MQNASLDILEIDAASNRSIDSIRDLKDKISLAPTQGKYKVYIIDEVHMLTTEAFNALLKTLEEPPSHAVFILATTEAHKLPATIISRTQRFSFKPISLTDLVSHLKNIAAAEKIDIETAALEVIAQAARGGFRDAISLLDQLAATGAQPITATTVRDLLGYTDDEAIAAVSTALAAGDAKAALIAISNLEATGTPATQLVAQLTDYWRQILLASAGAPTFKLAADEHIATASPARCAQIVQALLEVSRSAWPQLALEAAVVQLTAPVNEALSSVAAEASQRTRQAVTDSVRHEASSATTSTAAPKSAPSETLPATEPTAPQPVAAKLTPELWPKVLVLIKTQSVPLSASLQMYPADFSTDEIVIKPRFNFHRDLFLKATNLRLIEAAAAKVYGRPVRITARTDERTKPAAKTVDPSAELVSSALEILGGEVVE
jgi:DNA polymerase III subunit gamma/tau